MAKDKNSSYSLISRFTVGYKRFFAAALLTALFGISLNFMIPQIIRIAVDSLGNSTLPGFVSEILDSNFPESRPRLLLFSLLILICSLLSGAFDYISRVSLSKATEGFTKTLRDRLFRHIQSLPFKWHTDNLTGDIIQRCTSDVETIREFIAKHLIEVVRTLILLTVAMLLMFSMNVKLALIALLTIPIIVLYSMFFYGRIGRQFLVADEAEGELLSGVQENLTGVRVVRAFGREAYEREKFEGKLKNFTDLWVDLGYTLGLYWGIGDFATGFQLLSIVCSGTYFAVNGEISLGELIAFIGYTQTISWPVRNLGRTMSELSKAGVSIKRVADIFDARPEKPEDRSTDEKVSGDIVFDDVSFSYDDTPVLSHLGFTIKEGSTFGILGATGSGKSTIAYLLNRLYELPEGCGKITINGEDIKDIKLPVLRKSVGLVLQEPFLYSRTIGENISIASQDKSIDKIRSAAEISAVDENIMEFKNGYDTIVGERGVTLSGGQKQRSAIARTLMMGCPIMIFDDSMSAVDMETDEQIRSALKANTQGATVILISHRINTLMQADKILVLENGCACQLGSHTQLISQDGTYRRVYKMQSDASLMERRDI